AQRVMEAARSMHQIRETLSGIGQQMAIGLAPIVEMIANGFNKWIEDLGGAKNIAETLVDVIVGLIANFLDGIEAIGEKVNELVASIERLSKGPGDWLADWADKGAEATASLLDQLRDYDAWLEKRKNDEQALVAAGQAHRTLGEQFRNFVQNRFPPIRGGDVGGGGDFGNVFD